MASRKSRKVRYGVVGLGHIAQAAALPNSMHAEYAIRAAAGTLMPWRSVGGASGLNRQGTGARRRRGSL